MQTESIGPAQQAPVKAKFLSGAAVVGNLPAGQSLAQDDSETEWARGNLTPWHNYMMHRDAMESGSIRSHLFRPIVVSGS